MENQDPTQWLGFDVEEAIQYNKEQDGQNHQRDNRICVCGHPSGRHKPIIGREWQIECKPTAMPCRCKNHRAILEVSDMRDFLRKTTGNGGMHALGRGIASSIAKGHTFKWITPPTCDRCGTQGAVSPVCVTENGIIQTEPTGIDVLLCGTCRSEV